MNDIAIDIDRVDSSKILEEEVETEPKCQCLHDPDSIEVQQWDNGWPCDEPATHRVFTECDCGTGCPDRVYVMCTSCVDGALEHGGVLDIQPI